MTVTDHYTDEDVQAGATALAEAWDSDVLALDPDRLARAVLDAVAPAIAARALREAAEAADEVAGDIWGSGKYVPQDWLTARADGIEGKP